MDSITRMAQNRPALMTALRSMEPAKIARIRGAAEGMNNLDVCRAMIRRQPAQLRGISPEQLREAARIVAAACIETMGR